MVPIYENTHLSKEFVEKSMGLVALVRGWGESKIKQLEFNNIQWKLYLAMFRSKHQLIESEDNERDEI